MNIVLCSVSEKQNIKRRKVVRSGARNKNIRQIWQSAAVLVSLGEIFIDVADFSDKERNFSPITKPVLFW